MAEMSDELTAAYMMGVHSAPCWIPVEERSAGSRRERCVSHQRTRVAVWPSDDGDGIQGRRENGDEALEGLPGLPARGDALDAASRPSSGL